MREPLFAGIKNRLLQELADWLPGRLRVSLHRLRGVHVGDEVWIGRECLIETAYPSLVTIGNSATIGIRTTIIAHFQEALGVTIGDKAYIGAGALILPGVTVGEGAVIAAGSVVTTSVPPMTAVQGNPARRVARCGIPLERHTSRAEFVKQLKTLGRSSLAPQSLK